MEPTKPRGPRPIGDEIRAFLRDTGIGIAPLEARVFRAWREACGGDAARPVAFRSRDLVVEVATPALLQDLKSFNGDRFRRRANELLGDERIRRVIVKLKG